MQRTMEIREAAVPDTVVPAAPVPRRVRPGFIAAIRALRANPITVFGTEAYEKPAMQIGLRRNVLLISDPDAISRVLVDNAANYRKSVQQQRRLQPALGEGLLTAEGDAWRTARRVAAPLFAPRSVGSLFDDMLCAAEAMLERWSERSNLAQPVDLCAEFQRLTYEIVSRTFFSGALDADRARIHAHMAIYFDTIGRIDLASVLGLPAWLPSLAARRARPSIRFFRAVVEQVVARRLNELERSDVDPLDRLLHVTDPTTGEALSAGSVSDNVLTFLAAGHETTGIALAWILYLVALSPPTEQAVLDELRRVLGGAPVTREKLGRLTFTQAVVSEALRLYPPAPFIGRQALGRDDLAGHEVRQGMQILISPWIVHRHRELWPEPDAFMPQRFLDGGLDRLQRGAYLPFGLGPRVCIGQGFAVQEIMTVLATILPAFSFKIADPETISPLARITLRPQAGMAMLVRPRKVS
jgi:cytochrome P450